MNVRTMAYGTCLLTMALAPATFVTAHEPLSIRVSPAVAFAPANLIIQTRIDPDSYNRALEVVAESEDFYRSSTVPLEGDRAPKTTRFEFRSLPPGEYEVRASVIGADGQPTAIARTKAHVVETGSSR
jgi:hypothetical protein